MIYALPTIALVFLLFWSWKTRSWHDPTLVNVYFVGLFLTTLFLIYKVLGALWTN